MKKTLTVLIMVLIVAMLFVACNSNPNTDNSSSATQGGGSSSGSSSGSGGSSSGGSSSSGSGDSSGGAGDSSSNTWTVTFDLDGGSLANFDTTQQVTKNTAVLKPTTNPTKDNYMFMGWVKEGETTAYNFENTVTSNITIKATWKEPTAEELLKAFYVLNVINPANDELYTCLSSSEGTSEVNITQQLVNSKSEDLKKSLTEIFTLGTKRYLVTSVESSTASGKIVSDIEAENVYISFTYKRQTNSGENNDYDDTNWHDDSGTTEQTGYLAYSYKGVTTSNDATTKNLKSNIESSSLSELPTVSTATVTEYKDMTFYFGSTSSDLTACALDGAKLSNDEFAKVKAVYNSQDT